ncbi:unnamed protein product [Ilex paraguariensis]|uniref:Uncharacterized protein n=1 Tax=Ilex paraguariensis TaxID=185542 RepID=A0ABC8TQ29_9AQUA
MGASSLKPKRGSTQEEDPPNSTTALLSCTTDSSSTPPKSTTTTVPFVSLFLAACLALSVTGAFAFLFFSSSPSHSQLNQKSEHVAEFSRPLTKLSHPVVLLISSDGFRFGYQFKTDTPNIDRLIKDGTEADEGLIPVFPSITFPNHYSIVTGLYPAYHGIINNYFFDPDINDTFTRTTGGSDPKWWFGEPLWETVVNHGFNASAYFWPGSEASKGKWTCQEYFCKHFSESVPFKERVDTVLEYFDLPSDEIPAFMSLYFQDPDSLGHDVGPDDLEITEAVGTIDSMIGRLIQGLEKRGVFEDVHIILVGDHGMAGICERKIIFLDDLAIPKDWAESDWALLGIRPPVGYPLPEIVDNMTKGLEEVENGKHMKVYLKEDLPQRMHYAGTNRIPPIIGLLDEGFIVTQSRPAGEDSCGGAHGYDNKYFSMRSIFIGHGPRFPQGKKVHAFENVEIYNLVTSILNIKGAPNNGTEGFPNYVLLPRVAVHDDRRIRVGSENVFDTCQVPRGEGVCKADGT